MIVSFLFGIIVGMCLFGLLYIKYMYPLEKQLQDLKQGNDELFNKLKAMQNDS